MIHYIQNGNVFNSKADALVNPVNCVGVMNDGLAREFRQRYPECLDQYKEACATKLLKPGILILCTRQETPSIIMFPTKNHWRGKSRLEWINQGLAYLQNHYFEWKLMSIAMPQIGYGLGGLMWQDVSPLIEKYFADEDLDIEVYIGEASQKP